MLLLTGCGEIEDRGEVRGTVRLDGQPLDEGAIQFVPTEGNPGPPAWTTIRNGTFHIPAQTGPSIGKHRIVVNSIKATGRKLPPPIPGSEPVDERVETIPKRYNKESTLQREIKQGENVIDLDLESTP